MNRHKNAIRSDFELLNRSKALTFLSEVALRELANRLSSANFKRGEVIFPEEALAAGVHILLSGVAKITRLNRSGSERVTIALLAPGPVPEFLSPSVSQWHFRCEALSNCRVGSLSWDQFDAITRSAPPSDLRAFHQNNLTQWYRWSLGFLGFDVRERLLFTLRHLCSTFGITESRGTFLPVFLSHKDLADLVGATRPRVSEHLAELECEHLLIRQGRQLIVCLEKIENSTDVPNGSVVRASAQPHSLEEGQLRGPRTLGSAASVEPPIRKPFDNPRSRFGNNAR